MRGSFLSTSVVAAGLFCTFAASRDALAVPMRIQVVNAANNNGITVTDGGIGDNDPVTPGLMPLTPAAIGNVLINLVTGTSKPVASPGNAAALGFSGVQVNSSGAITLRFIIEDGDFAVTGQQLFNGSLGGALSAPAGSSITFNSYANDGNLVPDLGTDGSGAKPALVVPVGSIPLFAMDHVVGPGAFASAPSVAFTHTAPFSLFTVVTVNFSGAGSASWSLDVSVPEAVAAAIVPEPATVSMLVLGAAMMLRRSRRAISAPLP